MHTLNPWEPKKTFRRMHTVNNLHKNDWSAILELDQFLYYSDHLFLLLWYVCGEKGFLLDPAHLHLDLLLRNNHTKHVELEGYLDMCCYHWTCLSQLTHLYGCATLYLWSSPLMRWFIHDITLMTGQLCRFYCFLPQVCFQLTLLLES